MYGDGDNHAATVRWDVRYQPRRNTIAELLRWLLKTARRRLVYRLSLALALWLALSTTDIAGLSSASNAAVYDAIMRFLASEPEQPNDGDVTVVLWTEDGTQQFVEQGLAQRPWPIEYRAHAELLYTLVDFRPRAIFLDFAFLDEREEEGFGEMIAALGAAAEAGIPVYVSDLPEAERNALQPIGPPVEPNLRPVARLVPATISAEPVIRHYPVALDGNPSVAVALYRDLGQDQHPNRESSELDREFGMHWYRSQHDATDVYFGDVNPQSAWCRQFQANLAAEGVYKTAAKWAGSQCELFHAWLFDRTLTQKPLAAPPVIPADAVVFEEAPPLDPVPCRGLRPLGADPARDIEGRKMWEFLSCRIVMVGSGLLAGGDFRDTPLAPLQPSVLVHAQALQNLLDGNVYFNDPRWLAWISDVPGLGTAGMSRLAGALFLVISVGLYSLYFESSTRRQFGTRAQTRSHGPLALMAPGKAGFRALVGLFLTCSAVAVVISLVLVACRIDPGGWGDAFAGFVFLGATVVLPWVDRFVLWAMYRESVQIRFDTDTPARS